MYDAIRLRGVPDPNETDRRKRAESDLTAVRNILNILMMNVSYQI